MPIPMTDLIIREERPGDAAGIDLVLTEAFETPAEAQPVRKLREAGAVILSIVTERVAVVVGHVLFSPAVVGRPEGRLDVVALGPMAVAPANQGRGLAELLSQLLSAWSAQRERMVLGESRIRQPLKERRGSNRRTILVRSRWTRITFSMSR